jgi:adenosylmethionine-8-amino-7-oxononanoate aminotransferase
MTTTVETAAPSATSPSTKYDEAALQQKAKDHLWMHFARQSVMEDGPGVPIVVKGEGHHIWDSKGKKYFDALSGLFVVNAGHGRRRLAEVAAKQAEELAFFPIWSYAHPSAIELADRLAGYAPGDLNRVFFSTGGGEAVETAFKLPSITGSCRGARPSTRSSPVPSPTTALRRAPSPSPASRR